MIQELFVWIQRMGKLFSECLSIMTWLKIDGKYGTNVIPYFEKVIYFRGCHKIILINLSLNVCTLNQ